jgi:curved DNA-binding protein
MTAQDALRCLEVEAGADAAVLRRAFHAAVKASHPDRPGGDAARLRAAVEAYRLLQPRSSPQPASPPPRRRAAVLEITPAEAVTGGRRSLPGADGGDAAVLLPAGLRAGDRVRVAGRLLTVTVRGNGRMSVIGDHLCITVAVAPGLLRTGGRLTVTTPQGVRAFWVSGRDGARGLARLAGEGLPARGERPRGDLFIRLKPAASDVETPAQSKLRQFMADWAA